MIKFIGDFKDLKNIEFKFGRLYERNYICYHYSKNYTGSIWIWKAKRDVEIEDFYTNSDIVLRELIANNFILKQFGIVSMFNKNTNIVEPYDEKYWDFDIQKQNLYRLIQLSKEVCSKLKELYDKKMIILEGE